MSTFDTVMRSTTTQIGELLKKIEAEQRIQLMVNNISDALGRTNVSEVYVTTRYTDTLCMAFRSAQYSRPQLPRSVVAELLESLPPTTEALLRKSHYTVGVVPTWYAETNDDAEVTNVAPYVIEVHPVAIARSKICESETKLRWWSVVNGQRIEATAMLHAGRNGLVDYIATSQYNRERRTACAHLSGGNVVKYAGPANHYGVVMYYFDHDTPMDVVLHAVYENFYEQHTTLPGNVPA